MVGRMPRVRGKGKEGGGEVLTLTGSDQATRAFVKGMVVGSLMAAETDKLVQKLGWKMDVTEEGIPIFVTSSGKRFAIGVVELGDG